MTSEKPCAIGSEVELSSIYRSLLLPGFAADELEDEEQLRARWANGSLDGLYTGPALNPTAAAIGQRYSAGRTTLLCWLVVDTRHRSKGLGGLLVRAAVNRWVTLWSSSLVLAEVHQRSHSAADSVNHGDSSRRWDFYSRLGARILIPDFVQPPASAGRSAVSGLALIALRWPDSPVALARDARDFLDDYLPETAADDVLWREALDSAARRGYALSDM